MNPTPGMPRVRLKRIVAAVWPGPIGPNPRYIELMFVVCMEGGYGRLLRICPDIFERVL